ncbi:MAG: winged helix-turn-helix domain-containing protein [Candidatus Bathyarchaeia archaeon]
MPYQQEAKELNRKKIMQALSSPKTFMELWEAVQPTIRSRSSLSGHLKELKREQIVERKIIDDQLVYALSDKYRRSNAARPIIYAGIARKYFDEEIRPFIEKPDADFLKAYTEKLGALVLYALINDIEMGSGWAEVSLPVVKDRLWVEHHLFAKAKVGSYGPKADDPQEAIKPLAQIKENPAKFKPQTESLKTSLKKIFPDEVDRLEKLWQIR